MTVRELIDKLELLGADGEEILVPIGVSFAPLRTMKVKRMRQQYEDGTTYRHFWRPCRRGEHANVRSFVVMEP